ncbi:hypothetical protein S245_008444, partial [Arachis hypogaea]
MSLDLDLEVHYYCHCHHTHTRILASEITRMTVYINARKPAQHSDENNLWAIGMSHLRPTSDPEIWKKGPAFGMAGVHADGMDVLKVREVAKEAIERARRGDGPTLAECETYRFRGHSLADLDELSDPAEKARYAARDPISALKKYMIENKLANEQELKSIEKKIDEMRQLKEGVGHINMSFTGNSKRTRSSRYRLGAIVHLPCHQEHVGEAVSNPFRVKESRGKQSFQHIELYSFLHLLIIYRKPWYQTIWSYNANIKTYKKGRQRITYPLITSAATT